MFGVCRALGCKWVIAIICHPAFYTIANTDGHNSVQTTVASNQTTSLRMVLQKEAQVLQKEDQVLQKEDHVLQKKLRSVEDKLEELNRPLQQEQQKKLRAIEAKKNESMLFFGISIISNLVFVWGLSCFSRTGAVIYAIVASVFLFRLSGLTALVQLICLNVACVVIVYRVGPIGCVAFFPVLVADLGMTGCFSMVCKDSTGFCTVPNAFVLVWVFLVGYIDAFNQLQFAVFRVFFFYKMLIFFTIVDICGFYLLFCEPGKKNTRRVSS